MNAIRNLFAAFANLAASINALSGVVDVASGKLRQQLALDNPEVIEHQTATGKGLPVEPPEGKATGRNGRKASAS